MTWKIDDAQGNEAAKVKYDIVRYTRGIGLDLGCGPNKAFKHFLGIDSTIDTKLFGIAMKPDLIVEDCCDLSNYVHTSSCDFIFSSHLLEHIEDAAGAVAHWWSLLKVGGHMVLYLPHKDLYPNIGQPGANPDHKHDFLPGDVISMIPAGFDLLVNETRDQDTEYSFLLVARKRGDGYTTMPCHDPRPVKAACVVRHGGFGDQLQAAMLLPELRRQGYHITFLTTDKGRSILEHDPNIDDWYMVDVDQVPNAELTAFWNVTSKKYDKWINLNESVEGTFLAMPGRMNHSWPQPLRHKMMNVNYGEFAADLAEIPFAPEGFFYATTEEIDWASSYLDDIRTKVNGPIGTVTEPVYFVMFVLAGSSPHKWTPHQDKIVKAILQFLPKSFVIFVGDAACKILEMGWENHPRVICESGELSIRKTLALALLVDHVVGPETGVMNAVAFEFGVSKTVLLSHSSPENLTKHWLNADAIEGVAPCYPCHQLHHTAQFCPRDENKAAICQAGVDPHSIFNSIASRYESWAAALQRRAA